jgi:hypothetical protein
VLTPELQSKLASWRQQAMTGPLSVEEMKAAVIALRQSRMSAAQAAAKSKSSKSPARSADDLLGELNGL